MPKEPALIVRGVVSNLHVAQTEEEFAAAASEAAAGQIAAIGLGVAGLAGAATGAALSATDTAERVDFFTCKVDGRAVTGRFGKVNFANGDSVEVVGSSTKSWVQAYAITRPSDRTIWMHPHCGRGSHNYRRHCLRSITLASIGIPAVFVAALMAYFYVEEGNVIPIWFWLLAFAIGAAIIAGLLGFVATRFTKFANLSDEIFSALGFEDPRDVDLPQRLREAGKAGNVDRPRYHPYARWVYKY